MSAARTNRVFASLLALGAAGLFVGSAVLVARAWPTLSATATHYSLASARDADQCRALAGRLGLQASVHGADVVVTAPMDSIKNLHWNFAQASVAAAGCAGFQLASFCAGTGCGAHSLRMTLRPEDPDAK